MKRINEYKKLFNVEKDIDLKHLKTNYRNLVKEWHPDKFTANDELALEAEHKSRQIIDGYHFLVSIAPETIAQMKKIIQLQPKRALLILNSKVNCWKFHLWTAQRMSISAFQKTSISG